MTQVIKRNRKHQKFNAKKIERSVRMAMHDAERHVAREVSRSISKRVRGRRMVRSSQLARMALKSLGLHSKAAVAAWRKYVSGIADAEQLS